MTELSKPLSKLNVNEEDKNTTTTTTTTSNNNNNSNGAIISSIPRSLESKHPLECSWTMYFVQMPPGADYNKFEEYLFTIMADISTVEDFWGMFNNIAAPSTIPPGSDYSFFKKGIIPTWEHNDNKNGGKWQVGINKPQRNRLDDMWLNSLLGLIGESLEVENNEINGIVLNVRTKGDRIALWTRGCERDCVLRIGENFKKGLAPWDDKISFVSHKDASEASSQKNTKDTYTL